MLGENCSKIYPGERRWTPDSTCLALVWAGGGFSVWSTFGTMILCSLGWDHGPSITDPIKQVPFKSHWGTILRPRGFFLDHSYNIRETNKPKNKTTNLHLQAPYNILDMDWSGEGYQLWVINSATRRFTGTQDAEFCPFPQVPTYGIYLEN